MTHDTQLSHHTPTSTVDICEPGPLKALIYCIYELQISLDKRNSEGQRLILPDGKLVLVLEVKVPSMYQ